MITSVNAFPQPLPASSEEEGFLQSPRRRRRGWRRKPGFHKVSYGPPCHNRLAWPTQSYEKCGNNKAESEKFSVYHCILSVAWQTQAEHHASSCPEGRVRFGKWTAGAKTCHSSVSETSAEKMPKFCREVGKVLCRTWATTLEGGKVGHRDWHRNGSMRAGT